MEITLYFQAIDYEIMATSMLFNVMATYKKCVQIIAISPWALRNGVFIFYCDIFENLGYQKNRERLLRLIVQVIGYMF